MRNARGVLGDAAVVRERCYDFSVPKARRAQLQPLGLEDGDTSFAEGLSVGISRIMTRAPLKCLRGDGTRLPFKSPLWARRFDRYRQTQCDLPSYSAAASVAGRTDTNMRPLALVRNSTLPSTRANRVWSLPRPTFWPGCQVVPRWRAMMLPATALSPPNSLMPSRWRVGVAPVARRAACFFVCHDRVLNSLTLYRDSAWESSHKY